MPESLQKKLPAFGDAPSCVSPEQRHPIDRLPVDHFLIPLIKDTFPNLLAQEKTWLHTLSADGTALTRTYAIVALFFNLGDPGSLDNAANYTNTATGDITTWLAVGTPNRSTFLHNYWSTLSYGKLQVSVAPNTDAAGVPQLPTINPASNNADDWGNIAQQIVQLNPERVWQIAGSIADSGVRVIPSLVVVQNYDTHASAVLQWNWSFSSGGNNYRVDDICHVRMTDGIDVEAHEHGHNFLNSGDMYGGGGGKIGYWDLLGDALGPGKMSDTSSYFKEKLGWLSFNEVINGPVAPAEELRLRPYATTGDCYKVVPDPAHNPNEYFLLEFRVSTANDPWTPDGSRNPGGLLITHVNTRIGEDGSTSTSSSPFMDVEEADGNDGKCWDDRGICDVPWSDFPNATVRDAGASAFPPNNWPEPDRPMGTLFPAGARASFTPTSDPSSAFYGGRDSGLSITDIRLQDGNCLFTLALAGNDQNALALSDHWQRYVADFDGDGLDELLVFTGSTLALVDVCENEFHVVWRADDQLGEWRFGPNDRFTVGDFNGDGRADVFVRSDQWAGLFISDGASLSQVWITEDPSTGGDWVGGWHLGASDRTWAGDFDGDGRTDLFVRSPEWAVVLRSTGLGFETAWMSGDPAQDANWIGGWHLGAGDQHLVGDFDGDGRDDIFVHNGGWAGLLLSNGAGFDEAWMTGDPGQNGNWVGGWHVGAGDRFVAGDFNGDGSTDLWVHNGGWAAVWRSTGRGFEETWISGDPGTNGNWVEGWHLGQNDRYVCADFNGDGRDDLFVRSAQWAALLLSDGDQFHVQAMTGDPATNGNWIGPVHLTSSDDVEYPAQLHYLPQRALFQARADRTTAAFTPLAGDNGFYLDACWIGPDQFAARDQVVPVARYLTGHFTDARSDAVVVSDGSSLALWTHLETRPQLLGRFGPWIGGWHLGPQDRFTVADLDGDGKDELFVRSPGWAAVLRWRAETRNFVCDWISGDPAANANWVDGWHLGALDHEVPIDVDGSGRQSLFVRSPQWAGLFQLTNSVMRCPWMTGDPAANQDWIGGWHLGVQDRVVAGTFRGGEAADLFIRSPQWAGLLAWTGDGLDTVWMSGDPAANANWLDGWHLGPQDRESVGRFTGASDQILVRSRRWAGIFRWNEGASTMECPWMTGDPGSNQDWIGGWHLDARDRVTVADVDGDGRDEVFIRSAKWAGLLVGAGAGLASDMVQANNIGTWMFNRFDDACALRRRSGAAALFLHHPWGWTATADFVGAGQPRSFQLTNAHFRVLTA